MMQTYTLEQLEEVNGWVEHLLSPQPISESLLQKIGAKPPETRMQLLMLEDNKGFVCGLALPQHTLSVNKIIFDSIEKAIAFAIIVYKYGDIMALASYNVAGEA